ncbi:MAG TPA: DNA replication/repair protein RecF [Geobacterales bacterium]|nr:DNA replication/repair protein RecF [Geobacterales bacterium]
MQLTRLKLTAFRNFQQLSLEMGERCNVVHGANGQGKTNLLEAVYLLATMKSFRTSRNRELILHGQGTARVDGTIFNGGMVRQLRLDISGNSKTFHLDGKGVQRLSEVHGVLAAVLFTPDDLALVKGGPDQRRRFLDRAIFSGDLGYLALYQAFQRTLRQRNALLRSGNVSSLQIWSEQLAETAARLVTRRLSFMNELAQSLSTFYRQIADANQAAISYRPFRVEVGNGSFEAIRGGIIDALEASRDEERRLGVTLIGPHRDDLHLTIDAVAARGFASQGEQRSLVLALKMAEIELLTTRLGSPPILLLDDMTSELDRQRSDNLLAFLLQRQLQVVITTTRPEGIQLPAAAATRFHEVRQGTIVH